MDKALSLAVTFPTATNSWQLTRTNDTADWQLADAGATEKLDASKLSDLTTPLSSLTLADVAVPPVALTNPVTIAAKTADGFSYMFQVGAKSGDNYPVTFTVDAVLATNRPAGDTLAAKLAHESSLTNWSYLVAAYALDSVLKPRSDWLVAATNAPAK